ARSGVRVVVNVRAGNGRGYGGGTRARSGESLHPWLEGALSAGTDRDGPRNCTGDPRRYAVINGSRGTVHAARSGVPADARREERGDGGQAHTQHRAFPVADTAARQRTDAWPISAGRRRVLPHRYPGL